MKAKTFQTNTFLKGLDLDTDVNLVDNSSYRDATNIRVLANTDGTTGIIQNTQGTVDLLQLEEGEIVLGTTTVNDIAVIITLDAEGYNNVWKITGLDTNEPQSSKVIRASLGLTQRVCVVGNYESSDNIKIYFTDGTTTTKVVNIMKTYETDSEGITEDENQFDIVGGAVLYKPEFVQLVSGALTSGKVQYCIQLFNENGSQTLLSPLSDMIVVVSDEITNGSHNVEGDVQGSTTNKGVQILCQITTTSFERLRLYRLQYTDNNQVPTIIIVDEFNISIDEIGKEIYLNDTGNSYVSEITLDEFNAYTGYQFIAQTLCKMGNRLYAANITEDNWYPTEEEYDARAYRCNSSGQVTLQSTNVSDYITIDDFSTYDLSSIPYNHDCINPYNYVSLSDASDSDKYMYTYDDNGNLILGGHGINIDYRFVTTNIQLTRLQSISEEYGLYKDGFNRQIYPAGIIRYVGCNEVGTDIQYADEIAEEKWTTQNYSDPLYASKYVGYRRDEIYRFGIIFYNDRQVASQVYWIGDIRMPSAAQVPIFAQETNTFVGKALGINFIVKNIPEGAVSYEIVRCDRTSSDRTVIMQCVGGAIYEYDIQEDGDDGGIRGQGTKIDTSTEYRPMPFIGMPLYGGSYNYYNYPRYSLAIGNWNGTLNSDGSVSGGSLITSDTIYLSKRGKQYARMISPEICYEGESSEGYFETDTYLEQIGTYYSNASRVISETDTGLPFDGAQYTLGYDGSNYETRAFSTYVSANGNNSYIVQLYHQYYYPAYLAPYFRVFYADDGGLKTDYITDALYPPTMEYNQFQSVDVTSYKENVGEIVYMNYAMTQFGHTNASLDSGPFLGPAGPCVVVHVGSGDSTDIYTMHGEIYSEFDYVSLLPVYNLKRENASQYGGNTYYSRSTSTYISIGASCKNDQQINQGYFIVYGGDTYLDILDYPSMMTFQANEYTYRRDRTALIANYIPFETSINISLDCGDAEWRSVKSMGDDDLFVDSHVQLNPVQIGNYYVQDEAYYAYNDAYSAQSDSITYSSVDVYSESNQEYSNRIMVSEAKTNGEVTDSWTSFLTSNYLDVDNQYGPITNLITFKDKLFYFQDNAVGIASVNERSLITDNNVSTLTLGTGDILSRYDYVTNMYGTSVTNSKGIITSENALYWYDNNRNELMAYTGNIMNLSKEKNVQTYFDKNVFAEAISTLFDKKYNEVWFTFDDKTLTFNERLGQFTSFYSLTPDWVLPISNGNAIIDINSLQNIIKRINEGNNEDGSDITLIINKDMLYTKVFDNIFIAGNLTDNDSITSIEFNTKTQTATLEPIFDVREDTYRTSIPRADAVGTEEENLSFPARLRGKYLIVKYNFNNTNEVQFQIPEITTSYRYSRV